MSDHRRRRRRVRWHFKGERAYVTIPGGGHLDDTTIGAAGTSRAEQIHRAALAAQRIANDPILSAVLPPGTAAGVNAIVALSSAIRSGQGRAMLARLRGPGAQRLFAAIRRTPRIGKWWH